MFFQIPRKNADAFEVHVWIVARLAFADDVPVDLTRYRILNTVNDFHRGIRVFFAVLRHIGGNVELDRAGQNPTDFRR